MFSTVEKIYINDDWINEYKVTFTDGTLSTVPHDENNRHYLKIVECAAIDGNNITAPGE